MNLEFCIFSTADTPEKYKDFALNKDYKHAYQALIDTVEQPARLFQFLPDVLLGVFRGVAAATDQVPIAGVDPQSGHVTVVVKDNKVVAEWNTSHTTLKKGLAFSPVKFGISF